MTSEEEAGLEEAAAVQPVVAVDVMSIQCFRRDYADYDARCKWLHSNGTFMMPLGAQLNTPLFVYMDTNIYMYSVGRR